MPWQKTVANASTLWIFVVRSLFSMEMLNTQNKRFATLVAPIIKRNTRRPLGAKHPHGRYVATWDGVLGDLIHAAWKPSAKLALLGLHWKHIFFLTSSRMPNPNLNCPLFWGAWTLQKTQNALRTKKTPKASFLCVPFFPKYVETWKWNSIPQKWNIPPKRVRFQLQIPALPTFFNHIQLSTSNPTNHPGTSTVISGTFLTKSNKGGGDDLRWTSFSGGGIPRITVYTCRWWRIVTNRSASWENVQHVDSTVFLDSPDSSPCL